MSKSYLGFRKYSLSLIGVFAIIGSVCQPSSAVILRTGYNSGPLNFGGFINWSWNASGTPDQLIIEDQYWTLEFETQRSSTILRFTHNIATEPGEQPFNGPAEIDLGALRGLTRESYGFRHPGGIRDDADFFDITALIRSGRPNRLSFGAAHALISSRPGVPFLPPVPEPITVLGSVATLIIGSFLKQQYGRQVNHTVHN